MSTTLLPSFYDLDFLCKVRGGSKERRRRASRKPFKFSDFTFCPRLLGDPPSTLTFLVSRKIPKFAVVVLVPCGRGEGAGREKGQEGAAVAV